MSAYFFSFAISGGKLQKSILWYYNRGTYNIISFIFRVRADIFRARFIYFRGIVPRDGAIELGIRSAQRVIR